jgi:protein-arginine kinase activator protein McsA
MACSKFNNNESASHYRSYHTSVPTRVDAQVCGDCRKVATDILAGPAAFDTGWQSIQSEHATLTYLKRHLDGTVGSLRQSAERGCGLCNLIDKQLGSVGELASASPYHIFFWGRVPATCEFNVASGDIQRFL